MLQAAIPVGTYVTGVVATHVTFALLEKKRLENWQEKGEVISRIERNPNKKSRSSFGQTDYLHMQPFPLGTSSNQGACCH